MKIGEFEYKVLVEVEFTDQELEIIETCAIHHYDDTVKSMVGRGGFFYGWMNKIKIGQSRSVTCSPGQLGTCAKAIEIPAMANKLAFPAFLEEAQKARFKLQFALRNLLGNMEDEWKRINKDGEGDALRQLVAMYQGEADESELPEETEYKTLAKIREGERTNEQTGRLRELATLIRELYEIRDSLGVEILRARLAERSGHDGKATITT